MAVKYIFQLIWFLWLIEPLSAALTFAKPGCRVTCGEVTIPYPFGIGAGCFFDEWFEILCHHDRPYLSKYYGQELGGEVLDVSLDGSTVTTNANNSQIRVCEDKAILRLASNLSGSPFFYDSFNKVIVAGCGNVMLYGDQTIIGGCASACDHDQYRRINGCYGINCCVINPRSTAQNYYLNFTNLVKRSNSCASVTLDGRDSTSFSDMSENLFGVPTPVVLRWLIPGSKLPQLQNSENCIRELDYDNVTRYYRCNCRGCTEGNPYIPNGCQDSSNCVSSPSNSRKPLILRVVGGTSLGILFLVIACLLLYKTISKRREKKTKEKYFKRNGGLLLQQQLLVDKNSVDKVPSRTICGCFTQRKKSMWVDWVYANHLRDSNLWDVDIQSDAAWFWKKLLNVSNFFNIQLFTKLVMGILLSFGRILGTPMGFLKSLVPLPFVITSATQRCKISTQQFSQNFKLGKYYGLISHVVTTCSAIFSDLSDTLCR